MLSLISFKTGRRSQTQSSVKTTRWSETANRSLVLSGIGTTGREANASGEESERIYTRAPPKRVGGAFALLTKTYHGSRVTGNLGNGNNMSDLPFFQQLGLSKVQDHAFGAL
jgi:hypothetical protein